MFLNLSTLTFLLTLLIVISATFTPSSSQPDSIKKRQISRQDIVRRASRSRSARRSQVSPGAPGSGLCGIKPVNVPFLIGTTDDGMPQNGGYIGSSAFNSGRLQIGQATTKAGIFVLDDACNLHYSTDTTNTRAAVSTTSSTSSSYVSIQAPTGTDSALICTVNINSFLNCTDFVGLTVFRYNTASLELLLYSAAITDGQTTDRPVNIRSQPV